MNKCNKCEKENDSISKYCIDCGFKLNLTENIAENKHGIIENDSEIKAQIQKAEKTKKAGA